MNTIKLFIILVSSLSMELWAEQKTSYDFVKDFELVSAKTKGQKIIIKISHLRNYSKASFHFAPYEACKESFPPQCEGTLVRLDQGPRTGQVGQSVLEIRPEKLFPYSGPMLIDIKGPKKTIRVKY